jgi:hypothetical protein
LSIIIVKRGIMTAQTPERIFIDGKPNILDATPLYRLLASRRAKLKDDRYFTTACYRGYVGTWQIIDGMLHLVTVCMMRDDESPLSDVERRYFLSLVPCSTFPVPAFWFNGRLRIPLGRRLVYSHHGWSSWYERERVVTCRGGKVIRDRNVDTQRMLTWVLRRYPEMLGHLDADRQQSAGPGPLMWFDDSDDDWLSDWWPAGYDRSLTPS